MATKKITEQAQSQSVNDEASVLITQLEPIEEGSDEQAESLRRAPLDQLISALKSNGILTGVAKKIDGYFYNGEFFQDSSHTQQLEKVVSNIYVDITTNRPYRYDGTAYVSLTAGELFKAGVGENSVAAPSMDKNRVTGKNNVAFGTNTGWDLHLAGENNLISGVDHNVYGKKNAISGNSNTVGGNAQNNVVTGSGNGVQGESGVVSGIYNLVSGNNNNVAGEGNNVSGKDSAVVGAGNTISQGYNVVGGISNIVNHEKCVVGGNSNRTSANNQIVSGEYNDPHNDDLLVIGDGSASANKNAFAVRKGSSAVLGKMHVNEGSSDAWGGEMNGDYNLYVGNNHKTTKTPRMAGPSHHNICVGEEHKVSEYAQHSAIFGYSSYTGAAYTFNAGKDNGTHGACSAAIGEEVDAFKPNQIVVGRYSYPRENTASTPAPNGFFIVGGGSADDDAHRRNIMRVDTDATYVVSIQYIGADYAEYFEWEDGNEDNEDRVGYFVTLEGDKIRFCNADDTYILGVVSAFPAAVGDAQSDDWAGKYQKDAFGRYIYEDKEFVKYDTDGNEIARWTEKVNVINPDFDASAVYIPRSDRAEWDAVGTMGKLIVRDDGTCTPNGWCKPANGGIATKTTASAKVKYKVMKRIDEDKILVWIS